MDQPNNDHKPMSGHTVANLRLDGVTHMCPECGLNPNPFCIHCEGRGQLTDDELSAYQAWLYR